MNLTQRQLRMFVTTARLLHISRASEVLHISQPALTRALREFEHQVGLDLLHRTTRQVRLTPDGERFLPVAERLLHDLDHAATDLRAHAQGVRGALTIAVGAAFGATVLPVALQVFTARHPGVRVRLVEDNSAGITARVTRVEADLGIGSPIGDTASLVARPLLSAPLGLLAPPGRSATLPLLKEPADTSILNVLRSHGSDLVRRMERGVEVSSLTLQLALARQGLGIAVVSALGASHPQAHGMRFTPLRPMLRRELHALQHADRAEAPAVTAFLRVLAEVLPQEVRRLRPGVRPLVAAPG